jgi:hypothetical protein
MDWREAAAGGLPAPRDARRGSETSLYEIRADSPNVDSNKQSNAKASDVGGFPRSRLRDPRPVPIPE